MSNAASIDLPRIVDLGDGLTAVDVWQSIHASERNWIARAGGRPRFLFADMQDGSDLMLMQLLAQLPARRWYDLCNGGGWSAMAGAALSWCQDARLADVLHVFRALDLVAEPGNQVARAAAFLNPALLPENRMTALTAVTRDVSDLLVLIAARPVAPDYDLDQDFASLNRQVTAMIGSRSAPA